ncbi:MAG: membrane protein insertase YidC [Chloroflexi bacterium]|nr:membrane protein insertase YidC [Chloroflexota bacterium]
MWNTFILDPMLNLLIWMYGILGQNPILAIIALTLIINAIVFPLRYRQLSSTARMQEVQPKLKKLQEKYKDDPTKLQTEMMNLYREEGIQPLGGCLPTLIQLPILLGLYQAITRSLAQSPIQLLELSQHLYQVSPPFLPNSADLIPLDPTFLWLNLGQPDPTPILPILVVVSSFFQQRLLTPPSTDPQQAAMTRTLSIVMPLFIGYLSLTFPSGLSVYWVISSIIGTIQYAAMGRASLKNLFGTEDGSFSLKGLLGLGEPEDTSKKQRPKSMSRKRG